MTSTSVATRSPSAVAGDFEPRSRDHVLTVVRDRLYRAGPQGEGTVTTAYNRFDAGIGEAIAAVVEPYWVDRDEVLDHAEQQAYERWLTEMQGSMREEAIDAAVKAMAAELQLWLAARADLELSRR